MGIVGMAGEGHVGGYGMEWIELEDMISSIKDI